jgi:hypothetical protein
MWPWIGLELEIECTSVYETVTNDNKNLDDTSVNYTDETLTMDHSKIALF